MDTKRKVVAFLRKAIMDSRVSQTELARAVGITQPAISLFVNGEAGLKLATLDKLLDYFGMELTLRPKSPAPEAEQAPVLQGPPPTPRLSREAPKSVPLPSRPPPPVKETFGVPEQQWKRLQ